MATALHGRLTIFTRLSGRARARVMKSVVIKRSILINGRKTSVSLENEFWNALREIAGPEKFALATLVEQIDKERNNINLSSAIRVFVFTYVRELNGKKHNSGRHSADSLSLLARAEECRALAQGFKDLETRAIMLRVAADYELMAERLRRIVGAKHQRVESA